MDLRWLPMVVPLLLCRLPAPAQDLALTKDSELGFQRLIDAAQNGKLGNDVTNANVAVSSTRVQVELVRTDAPNKLLFLTQKTSAPGLSRYFDIALGEGSTANDAARVAEILDTAFRDDPFEASFDFFGTRGTNHLAPLAEAWTNGGWTRAGRVLAGYITAPAGLGYTVAVIAMVTIAVLASLILLLGSAP